MILILYFCSMLKSTPPYFYRAYGLNILSEICITTFNPGIFTVPDINIREGSVPKNLMNTTFEGEIFKSNIDEFLFTFKNLAIFYVCKGSEIGVKRIPGIRDDQLSAALSGVIMGAILQQRRMLPIHASSIIFKKKCILFAGKSHAGKTTLAAALLKEGASLVADDISVISFDNDIPYVYPAYPAIKIWQDTLNKIDIKNQGLIPIEKDIQKYFLPIINHCIEKTQVDNLIVIQNQNYQQPEIRFLNGIEKFKELKRHIILFNGIKGTDLERNNFELLTKLVSRLSVCVLYKSRKTDINEIVHKISSIL